MALSDIVEINRRFARSARLDADLNGTPPLVGYVLQASVEKALTTLAHAQVDSKQGAFTWTGPYGGGKSSAALLMANLVAGANENRKIAKAIAGKTLTAHFTKAFPDDNGPWAVVPVTGSRAGLRAAIGESARIALGWTDRTFQKAISSDDTLIEMLTAEASKGRSGLLLILDELGKMLEHEAASGGDIHLLQDIAERSSRSKGRLVVIGILHQSFDQYAAKAARDARQEWAKVQGRYQDISFLAAADETVSLLSRAISCTARPSAAKSLAATVAEAVAKRRPTDIDQLTNALALAWPLNPVTAMLLGPVSRQRFAQNERSVFGFLSSAEPAGFQDFLKSATDDETYGPDRLWDYLAFNFGMVLTGGSDSSRFSLAFEAIERAGAKGTSLHVALTKCAAAIEFFRNGSGLALADDFLAAATPWVSDDERKRAIQDLLDWAVLTKQPRLNGYALFAGSDFDLEDAISRARAPLTPDQVRGIPQRVGMGFVAAKRHYFRTGALRTFEIAIHLISDSDKPAKMAADIAAKQGAGAGTIVLMLGSGSQDAVEIDRVCKSIAKELHKLGAIAAVGGATRSYGLRESALELFAVERVHREYPQLEGDRIARREVAGRRSAAVDSVHRDLETALDAARWYLTPDPSKPLREPLAIVATELADSTFAKAPILQSELLQRDKPSTSAMAGLRALLHAMVKKSDSPDLGIDGYPVEMGLYLTVIKPFGLHQEVKPGKFDFSGPDDSEAGNSLITAWEELDRVKDISLEALYSVWSKPPYGMKAGIMPALALAHLLASRNRLAVYVEGVFQTGLDEVFVDKMLQKPADIRLRRIDRSIREMAFLNGLSTRLGLGDETSSLPIAQAIFRRFASLPTYSKRTDTASAPTLRVRSIVLKATDPEALLFEDLPGALGDDLSADLVYHSLVELEGMYGTLLDQLKGALARALAVDLQSFAGLKDRLQPIKNLTNDFRFDAFAMRAAAFDGEAGDLEGIASLLIHKPAHSWSDRDRDQAFLELARYGRQFRELEVLAAVRNRHSNTEALALVVGVDPKMPPLLRRFILTEAERSEATDLAERLLKTLSSDDQHGRIQFAALARVVASLAAANEETEVA